MRITYKFASVILTIVLSSASFAQSPQDYIKEDIERAAGYFHHYETPTVKDAKKKPKGYKAFYISHFGRHGCRWHTRGSVYGNTLEILDSANNIGLLTEQGRKLLQDVKILAEDSKGMLGDLTPRGVSEHKGIASRMYANYPEVFCPGARIDSKSTPVVRCILSMAAFNESLKEHEPGLEMSRESSPRGCSYFYGNHKDNYSDEKNACLDSLQDAWLRPERFIQSVFKDNGACIERKFRSPESFMYTCFELTAISQCCDYLDIDLYGMFTDEEIYSLWKYMNAYAYIKMGPSLKYGDARIENAKPLLRNIVETADNVIAGKEDISASLRFGHDSNIIPLVALMGIEGTDARVHFDLAEKEWNISKVSPMATNLQLVFFRNRKNDIKVRVLFKEEDAILPIEGAPFYDWDTLRQYLKSKYE